MTRREVRKFELNFSSLNFITGAPFIRLRQSSPPFHGSLYEMVGKGRVGEKTRQDKTTGPDDRQLENKLVGPPF